MAKRASRRIEYLVFCHQCEGEIHTTNPRHKFCSRECRSIYRHNMIAQLRPKKEPLATRDLFGFPKEEITGYKIGERLVDHDEFVAELMKI